MEQEEAFVAAVREHRHRLFRIAYGILCSSADAEDAVSDATEAAWKALPRLRDPECLPAYLIRCTVNASRAILRKRKRHEPLDVHLDTLSAPDPGVPVSCYVSGLKEKYRIPLILRYQENLRDEDIASLLHIPRGTVSTRITRALRMLRIEAEEEEPQP